MDLDRDRLIEVLMHIRRAPGTWGVRTHRELDTLLIGIGVACDLLPADEIRKWMAAQDGSGWSAPRNWRWSATAAAAVVEDYAERRNATARLPHEARTPTFTVDEERRMCDTMLDVAIGWLQRPGLDLTQYPAPGNGSA